MFSIFKSSATPKNNISMFETICVRMMWPAQQFQFNMPDSLLAVRKNNNIKLIEVEGMLE